jgi:hypothetical protein
MSKQAHVPTPARVEAFFDAYEALCKLHGLTLGHEDGHGAFIVEDYDESIIGWVRGAYLNLDDSLDE